MRDLNWDLLQRQRRTGSYATRRDRSYAPAQMANTLHEVGYPGLRANGLKGKHIEALLRDWSDRGPSNATMMNRMAHVRWWADQVGKGNMVKANAEYGIGPRSHVSDGARRRDLDEGKLVLVKDAHVRMALRLQAGFGLRREEAIKFSPSYADRGDPDRGEGGHRRGRLRPERAGPDGRPASAARRGAAAGRRRCADPAGPQLRPTEEGLRGPDQGGGARPVGGSDRLEGDGGRGAGPARTDGCGAAHRLGGASADLPGRVEVVRLYCG